MALSEELSQCFCLEDKMDGQVALNKLRTVRPREKEA